MAETVPQEQKAGNGKVLTEDTEYGGQVVDVTIGMDQKNESGTKNVPIETIRSMVMKFYLIKMSGMKKKLYG